MFKCHELTVQVKKGAIQLGFGSEVGAALGCESPPAFQEDWRRFCLRILGGYGQMWWEQPASVSRVGCSLALSPGDGEGTAEPACGEQEPPRPSQGPLEYPGVISKTGLVASRC